MRNEPEQNMTPPQPDPRQERIEQRAEQIYTGWRDVGRMRDLIDSIEDNHESRLMLAAIVQRALLDAQVPTRERSEFWYRLNYTPFLQWIERDCRERAEVQAAREIAEEERECAGMAECDDPDDRPEKLFGYHGES